MIKTPQIKKVLYNDGKLSLRKVAKYLSIAIGAIIIVCVLVFVFYPDPFINNILKERVMNAFTKAYPTYTLKLGDIHYNIWKNRLGFDSITLKSNDSTFICSADLFSIKGIGWLKILRQKDFTADNLSSSVIDAQKIVINFRKSQNELRFGMLHISVPDSEMIADSIKYYSSVDDKQFFAKSKFRQTRFRFNIPKINILGVDCHALLKGNSYNIKSIKIYDIFTDILVNMDKPYNKSSSNPMMPNEILSSMKEKIKVDSLKITNGRLNYSERYVVGTKPGVITFNKVNVSISGIDNSTTYPDTAVIHAQGLFMNSGTMKLSMKIPLASKDFSFRYSGSLSSMDMTNLNAFIEPGEHHRIKSGTLQSAAFNVNVKSGQASGTLRVAYKDITIVVLDKKTGSEKGIFNRILSLFGKTFIIRGTNMPDENGLLKQGDTIYTRNPDDYFLQFVWFALRNGIADVVGFPQKTLSEN